MAPGLLRGGGLKTTAETSHKTKTNQELCRTVWLEVAAHVRPFFGGEWPVPLRRPVFYAVLEAFTRGG